MMNVRAAIALEAGQPLVVDTVELAGPKAGEVLVEVKATGICHTEKYTLSGADPEGLFPQVHLWVMLLIQLQTTVVVRQT